MTTHQIAHLLRNHQQIHLRQSPTVISAQTVTLKTSQQSYEKERSRLVNPQSLKAMAIVVMHMFVMVIVQISQVGSLTYLPPSPSIGNNFLLISSLYYHMMKNIHTLSNHTRSRKLDHLKVLRNLLLVQ